MDPTSPLANGIKYSQYLFLILVLSVSLWQPVQANTLNILVLGDSLSAGYGINKNDGWVQLLENRLKQQHDVRIVNSSISGDTTGNGLDRLPKVLSQERFDIVLIELGGNDGLRGFPPTLIKKNLVKLIRLAQQETPHVLLLEMRIPTNYGVKYENQFNDTFHQAADATNAILVPFFLEQVAVNQNLMQKDRIHPTAEGQPIMMNHVLPYVNSVIQGIQQ